MEDELMSAVRGHGVDSLDKVREVRIEPDGLISVVTQQARAGGEAPDSSGNEKKKSPGG